MKGNEEGCLEPFTLEKCEELAKEITDSSRRKPLPIQTQYANNIQTEDKSNTLGRRYEIWSSKYEVWTLSHSTHDKTTLIKHTGRGQAPIIKPMRITPKPLPDHIVVDKCHMYLLTTYKHLQLLKCLYGNKEGTQWIATNRAIQRTPKPKKEEIKCKQEDYQRICKTLSAINHLKIPNLNLLIGIVDRAIKDTMNTIAREAREGFRKWVKKALENGAGVAHKWTTQNPKSPTITNLYHQRQR